jgi:hypothetical protein
MSVTVYVPGDAAALALGADSVAAAIAAEAAKRGIDIQARAQRFARHVLARAPGRSGYPTGPHCLWPRGCLRRAQPVRRRIA